MATQKKRLIRRDENASMHRLSKPLIIEQRLLKGADVMQRYKFKDSSAEWEAGYGKHCPHEREITAFIRFAYDHLAAHLPRALNAEEIVQGTVRFDARNQGNENVFYGALDNLTRPESNAFTPLLMKTEEGYYLPTKAFVIQEKMAGISSR